MKNKTLWILLVTALILLAAFFVMRGRTINYSDVQASVFSLLAATQPSTTKTPATVTTKTTTTVTPKLTTKEKADIAKKKICGTPLESCLSKGNAGYVMYTCRSIAPTRTQSKWTVKDWTSYYKCVSDKAVTDSPKCAQAHIACLEKQS